MKTTMSTTGHSACWTPATMALAQHTANKLHHDAIKLDDAHDAGSNQAR